MSESEAGGQKAEARKFQSLSWSSELSGFVPIDKPAGISSFSVVSRVRKILGVKKAGHAGTLDPFATGMLVVALSEATKLVEFAQAARKTYEFTVVFGESRDTDDVTGQVTASSGRIPAKEEIINALPRFTGEIMQAPPAFSAIKLDGKRAYDLARSGKAPEMASRPVSVYSFSLVEFAPPRAKFRVECGKGTYIRSLARDLAAELGSFAYTESLRRVRSGKFGEEAMISLETLAELVHNAARSERGFVLPPESVLDDILALDLSHVQAERLRKGQFLEASLFPSAKPGEKLAARENGKLVAFVEAKEGSLRPVRVFNF